MSGEPRKPDGGAKPEPAADNGLGTGEGASTALEALIRKRKLAEGPEPPDTQDPNAPRD